MALMRFRRWKNRQNFFHLLFIRISAYVFKGNRIWEDIYVYGIIGMAFISDCTYLSIMNNDLMVHATMNHATFDSVFQNDVIKTL